LVAAFAETFIGYASALRELARRTIEVATKGAKKVRGTRDHQRSEANPGKDEGSGGEQTAEQALPERFIRGLGGVG